MSDLAARLGHDVGVAIFERMRRDGWSRVLRQGEFHRYERPLNVPFVLRADFDVESSDSEGIVVLGDIIVICPEASDVLDALDADDSAAFVARSTEQTQERIAGPDDVQRAVGRLVDVTRAGAAALAPIGATVEAFEAAMRADPGLDDEVPKVIPVVLAVAGRKADARRVLAEQVARRPDDEDYAEFAGKVTDWLIGKGLPVRDEDAGTTIEWRDIWDTAKRGAAAEQHVLQAMRDLGSDATVDQRRTVLRTELERGGLSKSPLWIEQHADPRKPSLAGTARDVRGLVRVGRTLLKLIRRQVPESVTQSLVDAGKSGWAQVDVDPAAMEALRQAADASTLKTIAGAHIDVTVVVDRSDGAAQVLVGDVVVGRVAARSGERPPTATASGTSTLTVSGEVAFVGDPLRAVLEVPLSATEPHE